MATFDIEHSSATGYAIATGRPVISEDINHDSRFDTPDFLRQYGITSSVNAIIRRDQDDSIFGVLQCDSRMRRDFDEHDTDFLQNFGNILAAAIAQTNLHRRLSAVTEENAALRREFQSQRHAQFT